MNETKKWYLSKGVMGPLAALLASLIKNFGDSVGLAVDENQVAEAILQLIVLAGIVMGIVGRWRARTTITPPLGPTKPPNEQTPNI